MQVSSADICPLLPGHCTLTMTARDGDHASGGLIRTTTWHMQPTFSASTTFARSRIRLRTQTFEVRATQRPMLPPHTSP